MPIEIRELVIRAEVDPGEDRASRPRPAASSQSGSTAGPSQELLDACVEAVMRILESKRER